MLSEWEAETRYNMDFIVEKRKLDRAMDSFFEHEIIAVQLKIAALPPGFRQAAQKLLPHCLRDDPEQCSLSSAAGGGEDPESRPGVCGRHCAEHPQDHQVVIHSPPFSASADVPGLRLENRSLPLPGNPTFPPYDS